MVGSNFVTFLKSQFQKNLFLIEKKTNNDVDRSRIYQIIRGVAKYGFKKGSEVMTFVDENIK